MDINTLEKYVEKKWGYEVWYWNSDQYCGKKLHIAAGRKLSFHYHKLKDECLTVSRGKVKFYYSEGDNIDNATVLILEQGSSVHIAPGLRHRFEAITDCDLYEFSTHHEDSDSYRILKGD